jgi:uncharacterized protein (DUF1015 family)
VTEIRAFPAHVVRPGWAARVVSPMHDALRPEQRESIRRSNPDSYLHVTMRQDDPDGGGDPDKIATRSMAALSRLLDAGAFRSFDEPSIYAYRLRAEDHIQTGLVVEVPVAAFAAGEVRLHENVQPARVSALQRHLEAVPARSDPVALMHRPSADLTDIVSAVTDAEPVLQIEPDPDVAQSVWRITDPDVIAGIGAALAAEVLYVADGHHRVGASVAAWKDHGRPDHGAILCVVFPTDQLEIRAFHRLVRGPVDARALRAGLADGFALEVLEGPAPERGAIDVYVGGEWLRALPRDPGRHEGAEAFDVASLHRDILGPLLGLADPADARIEYVSDLEPVEGLARRADADDGAAFALAPPPVVELLDVADRGEVVAPKSTYFHPKPRSGVFVRLLDSVPGDREPKEQGWHLGSA